VQNTIPPPNKRSVCVCACVRACVRVCVGWGIRCWHKPHFTCLCPRTPRSIRWLIFVDKIVMDFSNRSPGLQLTVIEWCMNSAALSEQYFVPYTTLQSKSLRLLFIINDRNQRAASSVVFSDLCNLNRTGYLYYFPV
jgi:hypothetical protein